MIKHSIKIGFFVALAVLAIGGITMLLWNCLVPTLFGGPEITFGQTLGILVLSRILFGGWKSGGWCYGRNNCCGGKHSYWKNKMEQRWANMSPEEREKFKAKYAHCGWQPSDEPKTTSETV